MPIANVAVDVAQVEMGLGRVWVNGKSLLVESPGGFVFADVAMDDAQASERFGELILMARRTGIGCNEPSGDIVAGFIGSPCGLDVAGNVLHRSRQG